MSSGRSSPGEALVQIPVLWRVSATGEDPSVSRSCAWLIAGEIFHAEVGAVLLVSERAVPLCSGSVLAGSLRRKGVPWRMPARGPDGLMPAISRSRPRPQRRCPRLRFLRVQRRAERGAGALCAATVLKSPGVTARAAGRRIGAAVLANVLAGGVTEFHAVEEFTHHVRDLGDRQHAHCRSEG